MKQKFQKPNSYRKLHKRYRQFVCDIYGKLALKNKAKFMTRMICEYTKSSFFQRCIKFFLKQMTIFIGALLIGILIQYVLTLSAQDWSYLISQYWLGITPNYFQSALENEKFLQNRYDQILKLFPLKPPTFSFAYQLVNLYQQSLPLVITLSIFGFFATKLVFRTFTNHLELDDVTFFIDIILFLASGVTSMHIADVFAKQLKEVDKMRDIFLIDFEKYLKAKDNPRELTVNFDGLSEAITGKPVQQHPNFIDQCINILDQFINIWASNPSLCLGYGLLIAFYVNFFFLYFKKDT